MYESGSLGKNNKEMIADMTDKDLWEQIKSEYSNKNVYLLDNFRSIDGFNKRLGTWSPITNNSRYYKSLLLEFCKHLDFKISHSLGSKESSPLQLTLKKLMKSNFMPHLKWVYVERL